MVNIKYFILLILININSQILKAQNIEEFITDRFELTLNSMNIQNPDNLKYIIIYDMKSKMESFSTYEDMANWWSMPYYINRELYKNQAIYALHHYDMIAPLWIKVSKSINNEKLIILEISFRFKEVNSILSHSPKNKTAPFSFHQPYYSFEDKQKRSGLIDYILLTLNDSNEFQEYFSKNPIKISEIVDHVNHLFNKGRYVFFPINFATDIENNQNTLKYGLKYDNVNSVYNLINSKFASEQQFKNVSDAVRFYFDKQFNYKIGNLSISTN
ncbi:hypothetical protein [Aquimarina sp. AU119]|uniref:hypothetical protein n=1 Tax=Aquimarina sp. AU119 TaxID=2108528 RepID=UPI000D6910D4|nr:hypothetical protein [Aquimarina sp. AU119]